MHFEMHYLDNFWIFKGLTMDTLNVDPKVWCSNAVHLYKHIYSFLSRFFKIYKGTLMGTKTLIDVVTLSWNELVLIFE